MKGYRSKTEHLCFPLLQLGSLKMPWLLFNQSGPLFVFGCFPVNSLKKMHSQLHKKLNTCEIFCNTSQCSTRPETPELDCEVFDRFSLCSVQLLKRSLPSSFFFRLGWLSLAKTIFGICNCTFIIQHRETSEIEAQAGDS